MWPAAVKNLIVRGDNNICGVRIAHGDGGAGRNVNHTYLCRVPIDINYSVGFSTWLNIKQEKMKGEDRNGKEILKEIIW